MLSAKQIEIFYEVYKQGSMTAAAEGLANITTFNK